MPRTSRRLLAWAAALACVALQLSASAHHILVEHTHCVEHGDLSHAADGHDHAHAGTHEIPSEGAHLAASHMPAGDAHEHCLVTNRHRAHVSVAPVAVGDVPVAPRERWHRTSAAPLSIPALRQAPKTSPPV